MLIGLTGAAGAGKDTVYEMLAELYSRELPVERRSFADLLYASAAAALGVSAEDLGRWKRDPDAMVYVAARGGLGEMAGQTVRSFLQRYGTEAHRDVFGPEFWVEAVDLHDHRGRIVAVTDVRFTNEARAIHRAGGQVVRVLGPQDTRAGGHASEVPLPASLVDHTIHNAARNDGRRYLRAQVRSLVTWARRRNGECP